MKKIAALSLTLLLTIGLSSIASAKDSDWTGAVYGGLSMDRAGFSLSADYEYRWHRTYGIGAYFEMVQKKEGKQYGVTAAGAFIRPHFLRRRWDFYISPGFGFLTYDPSGSGDGTSSLGPAMMYGIMYQISSTLSVGAEHSQFYIWLDSDYAGKIYEDLKVSVRYKF